MKKSIFILLLLIHCISALQSKSHAQNLKKRDSLENYIKTAAADSNKVNSLLLLSTDLIQYDIEKARRYATEAIKISQKINLSKTEANGYLVLSKIHRAQNNTSTALNNIITAIKIFQRLNNKPGLANSYFELGYLYKDIEDYQKSIQNFSKSLQLYNETGNETKAASCQMVMGHVNADRAWILKDTSYNGKTFILYSKALNYFKKINDSEKIAVSLLNLANLYLGYNRITPSDHFLYTSLDYSNQSLKITQALNDKLRTSINYANIGEAYQGLKKYNTALDYYFKAYKMVKESGNVDFTLSTLRAIMTTYKEDKEYNKALEIAKEYLKIAKAGNYNEALKKYYELLSEIYYAQNNIEKAFNSRILYEKYSDSVLNNEKAKALIKMQVQFESENKDKEIVLLSKNQELQNAKLKQQSEIRNYLIASIILALLLLLVIYNRFLMRTKIHKIIQEKNKELEKLSIVARETASGVFITNASGEIEWFNEGFSKLFGWSSLEEYRKERGKNIFEVSGNANIDNLMKDSISEKKSVTYENFTPTKNKNNLWVQTTLTPIFDKQGELHKLVFVETDISELKNSEEQYLEINKELEAFSYSVSHDLRSPLRAINGYSKILQEDYSSVLDEDGMNALTVIMNNSKKMGELVDDLLTFSRLGRTELTTSEINMNDLVQTVITEEMTGISNEIEFIVKDLHPSKGTQSLIKQVWINLVSNAIKFSKNKTNARIEIGSYAKDNLIVYFVKDNGAGFDTRYYDKLFGVFQRLHSQNEFEGTGIGLAIVQKIVHRHGGTVWAESTLKEGSCFYFTLPTINI
ncbi:ATP-binding protein [Flavobacterium sp.]|uniref:ATP-binding protein n=1 Tax=Flavobacterium sp. TaxID=239 RepID=UPI002622E035|nr:ATP-binding protein [Flavobacterium sp.]